VLQPAFCDREQVMTLSRGELYKILQEFPAIAKCVTRSSHSPRSAGRS
jgi:hypothetical protein